ncbi:kinase-like domain-containing protein [Pilobolus umbonatus]|nr:kinase-like domain-containing protein [Pilobolus umbonatus]
MSNALLLRLFNSEFFNSWIAVSYLFRYSDNVGIQHYLCTELKKFPVSEIEFFLPQLIHLLITRPSDSVALECFVIEMCEQSTHMALMSLWYLQAYLADLSANPSSPSFELCKRLLNKCQTIIFSDGDNDMNSTSRQLNLSSQKVRENIRPALIGIGAMLAGIGQPLMTKPAGSIAIAQGRRYRNFGISANPSQLHRRNTTDNNQKEEHTGGSRNSTSSQRSYQRDSFSSHSNYHSYISSSQPELPISRKPSLHFNPFTSSPSLEDLHRGKAFSVSRYIKNAHQKLNRKMIQFQDDPSFKKSEGSSVNAKFSTLPGFDPKITALGRSTVPTNSIIPSPALSQCSSTEGKLTHHKASVKLSSYDSDDSSDSGEMENNSDVEHVQQSLSRMSVDNRKSLLKSNYFRSEMQFLLALVDIATRLVIVPKEARMSALHAELTLLNHNLPAEICLPLWCPATSDKPHHHRIVRISPSDAVVLNSAERAPYLLTIEVLDDEMSFEDDNYTSALYRIRLSKQKEKMKRKSLRKSLQSPVHSSSVVIKKVDKHQTADIGDYYIDRIKRSFSSDEHDTSPTTKDTTPRSALSQADGGSGTLTQGRSRSNSRSTDDYAERMRTAAVMLVQLQQSSMTNTSNHSTAANAPKLKQNTDQIRQRIIKEMITLENQRMKKMKKEGVGAGGDLLEDEQRVAWVVNKEDPSAAVLSEDWETKKARIRAASPYGHLPNWRLISVIVKTGADLRQEQFAIQLIREMQRIWQDTGVDVWVKYFRVLVTSDSSGLIETLRNTISIHSIKKDAYTRGWNEKGVVFTLHDYFQKAFGPVHDDEYIKAQDAFMRSLAGYSIACYVLQIKDRHNGNLLVDEAGHLIHIDFGFMLSNSPGSVGCEMAPFKLPQEYIDILGGINGEKFAEYKALMKAAFLAVRKHSENILLLTEMMSKDSKLPCFQNGDLTVQQLRDRFQLQLTEPQAEEFVDKLIMSSCCNVFTRLYDTFQYYSQNNGIVR